MTTNLTVPRRQMEVFFRPADEEGRYLPESLKYIEGADGEYLWWVNIQHGKRSPGGSLEQLPLNGELASKRYPLPGRPGFIFPTEDPGLLLVGIENALQIFRVSDSTLTHYLSLPCDPAVAIINDAVLFDDGRGAIVGTKEIETTEPLGALYLITFDDGAITTLLEHQICSNGKVVCEENGAHVLYDIDSPTRKVVRYALDLKGRALSNGSTVLDFRDLPGVPDGMIECGDGSVVIAFNGGSPHGLVRRYNLEERRIIEEWVVPDSPRVTCPALIDRDGPALAVVTAAEKMTPLERDKAREAGSLFVGQIDLKRRPSPLRARIARL